VADPKAKVVILGAGHAGGSAAAFLRQYGHEGPIVLIGDEPIPPYQRPPLSKAWLKGEADAASLALKDADWYAENDCDLRLGVTATAINRGSKTVVLTAGGPVPHARLGIAPRPRAPKPPLHGGAFGARAGDCYGFGDFGAGALALHRGRVDDHADARHAPAQGADDVAQRRGLR